MTRKDCHHHHSAFAFSLPRHSSPSSSSCLTTKSALCTPTPTKPTHSDPPRVDEAPSSPDALDTQLLLLLLLPPPPPRPSSSPLPNDIPPARAPSTTSTPRPPRGCSTRRARTRARGSAQTSTKPGSPWTRSTRGSHIPSARRRRCSSPCSSRRSLLVRSQRGTSSPPVDTTQTYPPRKHSLRRVACPPGRSGAGASRSTGSPLPPRRRTRRRRTRDRGSSAHRASSCDTRASGTRARRRSPPLLLPPWRCCSRPTPWSTRPRRTCAPCSAPQHPRARPRSRGTRSSARRSTGSARRCRARGRSAGTTRARTAGAARRSAATRPPPATCSACPRTCASGSTAPSPWRCGTRRARTRGCRRTGRPRRRDGRAGCRSRDRCRGLVKRG